VDEVRERLLARDLDHRYALAIAPLEVGIARDVDLLELEGDLRANLREHRPGCLAQVAALGGEEANARKPYG
jgi:hypothetical protein